MMPPKQMPSFRSLKQLEEATKTQREAIATKFDRKESVEIDDMAAVRTHRHKSLPRVSTDLW